MNELFCQHERTYLENRKTKFFPNDQPFGELCYSDGRFEKTLPDDEILFRNRGVTEDKARKIINRSLVRPYVVNIEDETWRGECAIYWR
jgi:hypothetical protein